MATWIIQRTNTDESPPRFEWLRARPTFIPGGTPAPAGVVGIVEGSVSSEDRVGDLRWTWRDAADPSGYRNGNVPRDFGREKAKRWAEMIDGAAARRVGNIEPDEVIDFNAREAEAKREARKARREALAKGTAEDLS